MIELDIEVDGRRHAVVIDDAGVHVDGTCFPVRCTREGSQAIVAVADRVHVVDLADAGTALVDGQAVPFRIHHLTGVAGAPEDTGAGHGPIRPPMAGRLESLAVSEGQDVARGDVLFVLEAMKMRNEVRAPAAGRIGAVYGAVGDTLDTATLVLELLPP